MAVIYYSRLS